MTTLGRGWRAAIWTQLADHAAQPPWDVIVVGGGVAGAGVFREAVRCGLRVLLLEGRDFAWGTSSRSSKLVHGGVRYLTQGQWRVTREAVRERERLVREAPGLVEPLRFVLALYEPERGRRWAYQACFTAYDLFARRRTHGYLAPSDVQRALPDVLTDGLVGGFRYTEARTDDARIVLRLIWEGVRAGGCALSYAPVDALLLDRGAASGVRVRDAESGQTLELRAHAVVNATGAHTDTLRRRVGDRGLIRPVRGSHLVFSAARFPLPHAVAWRHAADGRNVCALPWEGCTVVGTTDVDHDAARSAEPRISTEETEYLLDAVRTQFPSLALGLDDVVATWAGVRPIVGDGSDAAPTQASREHIVVDERGLISVAGGKLTTFHATARAVLRCLRDHCPGVRLPRSRVRAFDEVPRDGADHPALDAAASQRLVGRYGDAAGALVAAAHPGELAPVAGTPTLWAELRWAARAEGVCHLDDLLLRRVRVGLLLPEGGASLLPEVRRVCQEELGWSDARWEEESEDYRCRWRHAHGVPGQTRAPARGVAARRARDAAAPAGG